MQVRQRVTLSLGTCDTGPADAFLDSVTSALPLDSAQQRAAVSGGAPAQGPAADASNVSAAPQPLGHVLVPLLQELATQAGVWGNSEVDAFGEDAQAQDCMVRLAQVLYRAALQVRSCPCARPLALCRL